MPVDPTDPEIMREAWDLHGGDGCPNCGLTPFDTCESAYVGGCEKYRRVRDALHMVAVARDVNDQAAEVELVGEDVEALDEALNELADAFATYDAEGDTGGG